MLVVILLAFAAVLIARSGSERGADLLPSPDGLEYAAAAVNLDRGLGPVLHFGGYSYPSRYTEGYPLILAAAWPLLRERVSELWMVSAACGLIAIIALYALAFGLFGRPAAFFACLIMAASPTFITYSTLVLSDVPTLTVTVLAAVALAHAVSGAAQPRWRTPLMWVLFGLLGGFTVMIRPTNVTLLVGVAVVAALGAGPDLLLRARRWVPAAVLFVVGFVIAPLWQAHENAAHLGSALANGYAFWVPQVYGALGHTFSVRFLFGHTMPNNPYGNLPLYALVLTGLDGFLGAPGDPRFLLYPFAAAVFAIIGMVAALNHPPRAAAQRVIGFGVGFLGALLALYLVYFFTAETFLLPACFVLFLAAGYGLVLMNRALADSWGKRRKSQRDLAIIAAALVLDVLLAFSLINEVAHRAAVAGAGSQMVPALGHAARRIKPRAVVASNISLQFLDLYAPAPEREFVGLDSFDSGETFADYHLHRLYVKRAGGWGGPVPPVLFTDARPIKREAAALAAAARGGRPLYLLLAAPESRAYAGFLAGEISQLRSGFKLSLVAAPGPLALYEMAPLRATGAGDSTGPPNSPRSTK